MGYTGRTLRALTWMFCGTCVALPLLAMLWETVFGPDGLGVGAYAHILSDPTQRTQFWCSIELGVLATVVAFVFGFGHAWVCCRTDLPLARVLGPLGIAPLVVPPILVAMGFADLADVAGLGPCAFLLGVSHAPFVAILTTRGLRSIDGRIYESALVARGRGAAERLLFRMTLPETAAGCLFAFVFVVSEHGVPEFLTVKGKTWHTYAEGIFGLWTRRATGVDHDSLVGPIVAALPLVAIILIALLVALRLRAHTTFAGDFRPLPIRRLGRGRHLALACPLAYLLCGLGIPIAVMGRWAAGSTDASVPMSLEVLRASFRAAFSEASGDLGYTILVGIATVGILLPFATVLARVAVRSRSGAELWSILPLAVPATLLGIGFVKVYNSSVAARIYDHTGDLFDSWGLVAMAYAARFLPFGVLTLSGAWRRVPRELDDAAVLSGRSPAARMRHIHLPLLAPYAWSVACLVFVLALRELDLAVVLPAGNGTVVRRLSNIVHFGGENMGGALALMLLAAAVLVPLLIVILTGRRLRPLS